VPSPVASGNTADSNLPGEQHSLPRRATTEPESLDGGLQPWVETKRRGVGVDCRVDGIVRVAHQELALHAGSAFAARVCMPWWSGAR
jgi:hypothetical protein